MGSEQVKWKAGLIPWENADSDFSISELKSERFRGSAQGSFVRISPLLSLEGATWQASDNQFQRTHCSLSKSYRERCTKKCEVSVLFLNVSNPSMALVWDTNRLKNIHLPCLLNPWMQQVNNPKCLAGSLFLFYLGKI